MGYFFWWGIPRSKENPQRISAYVAEQVAAEHALADLTDVNIPAPADGEVLTYDTGTTKWIAAAGGGVGDWQVIAEVNVAETCDYVEFTGLDLNTDKVYILFVNIHNVYAGNPTIYLFREADYTATNYYTQYIYADGAALSAGRVNVPSLLYIPQGEALAGVAFIYRDTDGYMQAQAFGMRGRAATVRQENKYISSSNTTPNITSLRAQGDVAAAIGAGSYLLLCRPRS